MSYNRPPHQPPSGYPPQGQPPYPPNPGYAGPPPPSGSAPGGHYPPPPQGGYYPPGPYGGYPQGPPPQGYPYPPHSPHPPSQQGPPPGPPGPYGHPPPGPPPGPYGAPPPPLGGYSVAPPAGPSLGYIPNQVAPGDFRPQAEALRKAMRGIGTDETALIRLLAPLDPLQMAAVRQTYTHHIKRDLYKDVKSETSKDFQDGLLAIIEGPLMNDAELVRTAVEGVGTKEWLLNDVLLGRSNADMHAIRNAYHHRFGRSLENDVKGDLSAETKALFVSVVSATRHEESTPINPAAIENEVRSIYGSTTRQNRNVGEVCAIFAKSSNNELRAINQAFHQRYHIELEKRISDEISGHMKAALIHMLRTATDPAFRDAAALEECMAGPGTRDFKLVTRIVRLHWNKDHLDQVKRAYRHHFKRDLRDRVRGETSGDYRKLMLALLE